MDNSLKVVVLLYILTCVSVGLDITVLRQVFGFIYLSFVLGYLFIKILKLDKADRLEIVVFSAGSSIAFLMFLGMLLNDIYTALNLSRPLSTIPTMITVSGLTLILFLLSYREKGEEAKPFSLGNMSANTILQICLLCVLPALSIFGALYNNTSALLVMILGVAVLCAASMFSDLVIPRKIFPLAIASVSIALLFHTALTSKYLIGGDIHAEFYVFTLTEIGGYWRSPGPLMVYSIIDSLNSILSITILPTIYTAILGIDGEIFFKLFYPLVLSLIPLVLYKMYEQQTNKKIAFLSAFFFMSTPVVFYGIEPLALARQIIGQFFFILSMLLVTERKLALAKKRVLLVIFGAALIVSHYSLAYIFIFYMIILFVLSRKRILSYRKITIPVLTTSLILLLIALTFSWYIYVSDSPLNQLLNSGQRIISWFGTDMFSTEARFQPALGSLSPTATTSLVGMVHKALIYLENFFIGIGILVLIIKPKEFNLSPEFRLVAITTGLLFVLCLGIPNFATALNFTRFYAILIPFLAPFSVLGCLFLVGLTRKHVSLHLPKTRTLLVKDLGLYIATFVIVATFLFQVGFVNHITGGYPYSYSLDFDRKENSNDLSIRIAAHTMYLVDQEVFSAKWLRENMNPTSKVYADWFSRYHVLRSYACLPDDRKLPITNGTMVESGAYVYMKYVNVKIGVISTVSFGFLNISDISPVLENCDKIYSNGCSDIFHKP